MSNRSNKTFFIPMLCRLSINDTVKPAKLSEPSVVDPASPKLSCIGQIKKKSTTTTTTTTTNNSNRFLACRFSASTNGKSSVHSSFSYTKLHRLFSGKNLISPAIDTASINNCTSKCITNRSNSCKGTGRRPISTKKKYHKTSSDDPVLMRVVVAEELDPPLPVVKCIRRDQEANVNLCKRRGIEMKTLQIQPIQLSKDRYTNNNNVNCKFSLQTSAKTL